MLYFNMHIKLEFKNLIYEYGASWINQKITDIYSQWSNARSHLFCAFQLNVFCYMVEVFFEIKHLNYLFCFFFFWWNYLNLWVKSFHPINYLNPYTYSTFLFNSLSISLLHSFSLLAFISSLLCWFQPEQ